MPIGSIIMKYERTYIFIKSVQFFYFLREVPAPVGKINDQLKNGVWYSGTALSLTV